MIKKKDRINIVKNKNGLTLIEVLLVMTIVTMGGVMMIGIFNSLGITARARDTQRKKDLRRIKIAFEEYFNDKGYFPDSNLIANLSDKSKCGSDVFVPYLNSWPCDPKGNPYFIANEGINTRFRVITNLENKNDKDIPDGWYLKGDDYRLFTWTIDQVNYGVSSSNILWYEEASKDYSMCETNECVKLGLDDKCGDVTTSGGCSGSNCFYGAKDHSQHCKVCQVNKCGSD